MAVTVAARDAEIRRIKGKMRLPARATITGSLKNIWVKDDRRERHNEGMSAVNVDAKVARKTVRPGKWVKYEPGAGGAGTYARTDQIFTALTGGGCTGF
jgi:hypothetical protein